MQIILGSVSPRKTRGKSELSDALTREYIVRAGRMMLVEMVTFNTEAALLAATERTAGSAVRPAAYLTLFDSHGEMLSSESFSHALGRLRDESHPRLVYGIGPADGWSEAARSRANRTISLGAMTLPHELARVVAAEQIYRALTILAGHPYHLGH